MKLTSDVRDLPWKKISVVGVILLVLAGSAAATWSYLHPAPRHPTTPEENRAAVNKHLKDRAGTSSFKAPIEVLSEKNPWTVLAKDYDAPPDYKTVYRNIGEDLIIAEKLLEGAKDREKILGMKMITDLCTIAQSVAYDPWLAARIADGYLMPNLEKFEDKPKNGPSREQLLNVARKIYRDAEETGRLIEIGKAYLATTTNPERADRLRWSLARELEQAGEHKEALAYLRQISHSSLTNEAHRRIPIVERRLQSTGN